MNVTLSLSNRLRLTAAIRDATKDDRRLSAAELIAHVAPVLDGFGLPPAQAAQLLDGVVKSFNDGSTVDAEAHKLLAAASEGFELGTRSPEAQLFADMLQLMQESDWSFSVGKTRVGPAQALEAVKGGQAVEVSAVFPDGYMYTYDHQPWREERSGLDRQYVKITTPIELTTLVERGIANPIPKTKVEDIGQGLTPQWRRRSPGDPIG